MLKLIQTKYGYTVKRYKCGYMHVLVCVCSCYILGACHVCKNAEKGVSACVLVAVCQDECLQVYCHDVVGCDGS